VQPSNPSGRVFTASGAGDHCGSGRGGRRVCHHRRGLRGTSVCPHRHTYFAALPGWRRTISCGSLSKTYFDHGLASGLRHCCAGGNKRVRAKVHDFLTVARRRPCKKPQLAGLNLPDRYLRRVAGQPTPPSATLPRFSAADWIALLRARGRVLRDGRHRRVQDGLTTALFCDCCEGRGAWPRSWVQFFSRIR